MKNNFQVNSIRDLKIYLLLIINLDMNKTIENEELLRMLRLETDLGRYQTFVINSGKVERGKNVFKIKILRFILAYICIT